MLVGHIFFLIMYFLFFCAFPVFSVCQNTQKDDYNQQMTCNIYKYQFYKVWGIASKAINFKKYSTKRHTRGTLYHKNAQNAQNTINLIFYVVKSVWLFSDPFLWLTTNCMHNMSKYWAERKAVIKIPCCVWAYHFSDQYKGAFWSGAKLLKHLRYEACKSNVPKWGFTRKEKDNPIYTKRCKVLRLLSNIFFIKALFQT